MSASDNRTRRLLRLLRPASNPLARTSDRAEAWSLILFVLLGLLAFPVAAAAASEVYANEKVLSEQENATRYHASAVLTADAHQVNYGNRGVPGVEKVSTPARWSGRDGLVRTGDIPAAEGAVAGSRVSVWLDRDGAVAAQPRTTTGAAITGFAAVFVLWGGTVAGCALGFLGIRWALNRSRYTRWGREWESAESDWTRN
jgi:hypothetical protein